MPSTYSIPTPFPTDEESIESRRVRAHAEHADVTARQEADAFFGHFDVTSTERLSPYRVEIRALNTNLNACECLDYMTNRLGTCKHIERVLQHLCDGRMVDYAEAAVTGPPWHEVFVDMQTEPPTVKLIRPENPCADAADILEPFFDPDGHLSGAPLSAIPQLRTALSYAAPETRNRVRISHALDAWIDVLARHEQRQTKRAEWLSDVSRGTRPRNPLQQPLPGYQEEGMLHLAFGERAMLADEMGLGKSTQALAACELLRDFSSTQKVLVVTTASQKSAWLNQIAHATDSKALTVSGPRTERRDIYNDPAYYVIASYEQVRTDIEQINAILAPDIVILDDAQRIKHWPTLTAKAVKKLQSSYAFVLTGTPLQDRLEEIYSLVEFLDPHLFGALFRFQREFFGLDRRGNVLPRNLEELHRRINTVMLRRRKQEVADALPLCTVRTYQVAMSTEQRTPYQKHATRAQKLVERGLTAADAGEHTLSTVLSCMRMLCDSAHLLDETLYESPKCDELAHIFDEILPHSEEKVILFSEWPAMLRRIAALLEDRSITYAMHTRDMTTRERLAAETDLSDDTTCRVLLYEDADAAQSHLPEAQVVINMDQPWHPAQREQRIARARRGNSSAPITVIDLVTQDSIESALYNSAAPARSLADAVLDGEIIAPSESSAEGLQRVRALLGMTEGVPSPSEPTPADARDEWVARIVASAPEGIYRIEATAQLSLLLVVLADGGPEKLVRNACQSVLPDARIQILFKSAYDAVAALHTEGLLSYTMDLELLYERRSAH